MADGTLMAGGYGDDDDKQARVLKSSGKVAHKSASKDTVAISDDNKPLFDFFPRSLSSAASQKDIQQLAAGLGECNLQCRRGRICVYLPAIGYRFVGGVGGFGLSQPRHKAVITQEQMALLQDSPPSGLPRCRRTSYLWRSKLPRLVRTGPA